LSPNPFGGNLTVSYKLPYTGKVKVSIIDVQGRTLAVKDADARKGMNEMEFDTNDFANGIYFVMVNYNGVNSSYKMIVKE
jgi:hypothetical protein